jgi:hypothetical protein
MKIFLALAIGMTVGLAVEAQTGATQGVIARW